MRRSPKEQAKHGGGAYRDSSGEVTGAGLNNSLVRSELPGNLTREGVIHVTQQSSQGGSDLAGKVQALVQPKKQHVMFHELGKSNGLVEKMGNETFLLDVSLSSSPGTQPILADTMQWEKEQKLALGRTYPKVTSFPTSHQSNFPAETELSGAEDDFPPGFEGHHRMGDHGEKELNAFEGHEGNLESSELRLPQHAALDALSLVKPCGPYQ